MHLPPHFVEGDSVSEDGSTFSSLRADAPPFYGQSYEPINIAIYNDGVPSMAVSGEHGLSDVLHGIEDPIDCYPPDAEEAFELEMAEHFVNEMVNLSFLEEREMKARNGFTHLKKRWEIRRATGPSGRPKKAMHLIVPVEHVAKRPVTLVQDLVVSSRHNHRQHTEQRMRADDIKHGTEPRSMKKTATKHTQQIQQPRKQN